MIENNKLIRGEKTIKFVCKTCGTIIESGKCGDHREKTSHKDFIAIEEKQIISSRLHKCL